MTLKVVELRPPEADQELVDTLRTLLDQAQQGRLVGMAAVALNADRTITTVITSSDDRFTLSHGISALWFRFQQRMADDAYAP